MAPSTRSSRTQPAASNTNKPSTVKSKIGKAKPKTTSSAPKDRVTKPKSFNRMKGTKRGASNVDDEMVDNNVESLENGSDGNEPRSKKQKTEEDSLKQTTLDDTIITGKDEQNGNKHVAEPDKQAETKNVDKIEVETDDATKGESKENGHAIEAESDDILPTEESKEELKPSTGKDKPSTASDKPHSPPSSVLEKGVLYFFTRPRVNIEGDPKSFTDIQRSYIVMRPIALKAAIPASGEIGDGEGEAKKEGEGDAKKNEGLMRVLAVPKKKLLGAGGRFLTFVEKAQATIEQIKKDILQSSTYDTKTLGQRTNPAAQPLGTAVYAITQSGRTSHIVYVVVHDSDAGLTPLQKDFGLKDTGSFVISVKNPKNKTAPGVGLDNDPGYSEELMKAFGDRAWNSVNPAYLEYEGAEILMIGEKQSLKESDTEAEAVDELEKMAEEDEERIKELSTGKHDDGIFEDLELSRGEYGDGIKLEF